MSHDDIVIIGDSFAGHRLDDSDWPRLVATLQTGVNQTPRGQGFGGASWWSIRKCLLAELEAKVPQALILCHTESSRLPSDFDFGINISSVFDPDQNHSYHPGIKSAAAQYYEYLICNDYVDWAQAAWFRELDSILEQYAVPKVIHLHCFSPVMRDPAKYHTLYEHVHCFRNGLTNSVPLWDLCRDVDQRTSRNHFSIEQNIKIAHSINTILENYQSMPKYFDMKLVG
jgi:hypothetical protein